MLTVLNVKNLARKRETAPAIWNEIAPEISAAPPPYFLVFPKLLKTCQAQVSRNTSLVQGTSTLLHATYTQEFDLLRLKANQC